MSMTMSDIARLAGVQRPVVSVWRSRYPQGSRHPFPEPLSVDGAHRGLEFSGDDVVDWLRATGRGNNPEVRSERALHAEAMRALAADPDAASTLLLLHHVAQMPLADLSPGAVDEALLMAQLPPQILPVETDLTAPETADLLAHVDAVADAAYSPEAALEHLFAALVPRSDEWAVGALSDRARALVAAVLSEMRAESTLPLTPTNRGALLLLAQALPPAEEVGRRELVALPHLLAGPKDRAVWRLVAARGHHIDVASGGEGDDGGLVLPTAGCLAVTIADSGAQRAMVAEELDELLLALGPADRALVLGPASLMTAASGAKDRRSLLRDAAASDILLRYAAWLPRNLQSRSARRRLAVWVLAGPESVPSSDMTVAADHGDARLTDADVQAIAADIAVVMSGDDADIHGHAFRAGGPMPAQQARLTEEITAPRRAGLPDTLGSDLLAEAWNADPQLVGELGAMADRAVALETRVGWAELTGRYGKDRPGVRIAPEELEASGPGTVTVIGPEEVRGLHPRGGRRIDRMRLEELAPRSRFTEAGDVLYVSAGGPAAVVDQTGGHLVLAPVRVFRARTPDPVDPQGLRAVPEVVARDIAAQRVSDKDAWRIRLADQRRQPDLEALHREVTARRAALQDQLDRLGRAEGALVSALAAGAARLPSATPHDAPSPGSTETMTTAATVAEEE